MLTPAEIKTWRNRIHDERAAAKRALEAAQYNDELAKAKMRVDLDALYRACQHKYDSWGVNCLLCGKPEDLEVSQ